MLGAAALQVVMLVLRLEAGRELVPLTKFAAWPLLLMISVVLVTLVHRPSAPEAQEQRRGRRQ